MSWRLSLGRDDSVPHRGQPPGVIRGVPCGLYAITVHVRGIGPFCGSTTALMAAQPGADGFRANSRPRAVGELLGGLAGSYVNLIGDKRFPAGAFLRWHGPCPEPGSVTRTILETPRADLHADFNSYEQPVELREPHQERLFGLMTLQPASASDFPKTNYLRLIDTIDDTLQRSLFDRVAFAAPETRRFLRLLRRAATKARDDAEFVMAWMLCSRGLTFSHCYVGRTLDSEFEERLAEASAISPLAPGSSRAIDLTENDELVTLRIRSFEGDSYDAIDEAFGHVVARNPRGLIIDLRDNPGGTYISGRVAAHLVGADISMGVFFNREARARVLAGALADFPQVGAISSEDEFNSLIREHGAFTGAIHPVSPVYRGPVVVLTNASTASACEPLVAGLQEIGRATVIGERTAGSVLWTTGFDLEDGWRLWAPTVDYVTGTGARLDRVGVVPDIEARSADAARLASEYLSAVPR